MSRVHDHLAKQILHEAGAIFRESLTHDPPASQVKALCHEHREAFIRGLFLNLFPMVGGGWRGIFEYRKPCQSIEIYFDAAFLTWRSDLYFSEVQGGTNNTVRSLILFLGLRYRIREEQIAALIGRAAARVALVKD